MNQTPWRTTLKALAQFDASFSKQVKLSYLFIHAKIAEIWVNLYGVVSLSYS
ncbi:hypothetical protein SAMN05216327_118114 [Dyadobacter sp. SG02]|nr:hypothetical protein SAMN05216327_118114 [Dyadobacter sp. SG02]